MKSKKELESLKKRFSELGSFIEEENDKCLVIFQSPKWDRDSMDRDLGLIAAILLENIIYDDVYSRKSKDVWEDGTDAEDLVYEYNKKHTKKIKEIEIKYYFGEFKTDAKSMSDMMMFNINFLDPKNWREPLIKRKSKERDRDHDERIEILKKMMVDAEKKLANSVGEKSKKIVVNVTVEDRGKSGLISSEKRPGESEQEHNKRIDTQKKI